MEILEIFVTPLLVGIAGILIHQGFKHEYTTRWKLVGGGLFALALAGLLFGHFTSLGSLATFFAFFISLAIGIVTLTICVLIVVTFSNRRKLISIGFAIVTALVILGGWKIGNYFTPEDTVKRHAEVVVQALENHYSEINTYPSTLSKLVPAHLPQLPDAVTTQGTGWLYKSNGETYTLGYWMWPEKYGVYLCLYSSKSRGERECRSTGNNIDGWEPFSPVPTPGYEDN